MRPETLGNMLDGLWLAYDAEQQEAKQEGYHLIRHLDRADFMAIMKPRFLKLAPDLSSNRAKHAVAGFFNEINSSFLSYPIRWQRPFREAFDRGEIDAVALGAAVTHIYRAHYPRPRYRGEFHAETLANLRLADPIGIMSDRAHNAWRNMPDRVRIYRGAVTHSANQAAEGISWSLLRSGASAHLYCRKGMVFRGCDGGRVYETEKRRPHLLSTLAPKTAIIAIHNTRDDELFVDYERLDHSYITSLSTDDLSSTEAGIAVQRPTPLKENL